MKSLTKGGRIRIPGKRELLLTRLEHETHIALSLCKEAEQRDTLLLEYMAFFVEILRKYSRFKLVELKMASEKVLNALMEIIPGEKLV